MDISRLYQCFLESTSVSTDSRNVNQNDLFFALKGPNFNGNKYAEKALKAGASYAVVDEQKYAVNDRCILVEDGLQALQDLANYHRKKWKGYLFALTGSNGKTTTKELINGVLSKEKKTLATQGNLNNHIGVPLTLLRLTEDIEVAIIEMGANHVGEIKSYCAIAEPDGGLITNIGKAHIGTFGGVEGIIRGKSELYDYLLKNNGDVFINTTDPVLKNMQKRFESPYTYPLEGDYCEVEQLESSDYVKYDYHGEAVSHLSGSYNFSNIAAALTVGKFFGIEANKMKRAIQLYVPDNFRSQIIQKGQSTVFMDAYNANPTSMLASLQHLVDVKTEKEKWAIIGSMFELGEEEEEEHKKIGEWLETQDIKTVFVGSLMKHAWEASGQGVYMETTAKAAEFIKNWPRSSKYILIKGSRGMRLEELIPVI